MIYKKVTPFKGADGNYHTFYAVINRQNGKTYYGKHSTVMLEDGYLGSGEVINLAIKKYGKRNFKRFDLCFFSSSDDAFDFEEVAVDEFCVGKDWCYNAKGGGKGASPGKLNHMYGRTGSAHHNFGKDFSWVDRAHLTDPEYLKQLSEDKIGKISVKYEDGVSALLPKDHPDVISGKAVFVCVGREVTTETRDKLSLIMKGRTISEDQKLNQIKAMSNPETREKMSQSAKGKVITDETKANMSKAQRNRQPPSNETKKKMSDAKLGKKLNITEEGLLALSIARKRRITCPHCNKDGVIGNMKRWHFDNCKEKGDKDERNEKMA